MHDQAAPFRERNQSGLRSSGLDQATTEMVMGKGILLWLIGIPIPVIIILWLIFR